MLDQCYFLLAPMSNDYKKGRVTAPR